MHLICSLDKTAPLNHGLYTPITVAAPAGTLVNPEFPAACGVRHAAVIRTMVRSALDAGGFPHADEHRADAAGFERAGGAPGIQRWHRLGLGIRGGTQGERQAGGRTGTRRLVVGFLHGH